jgi:outer membrane immunogenic protein
MKKINFKILLTIFSFLLLDIAQAEIMEDFDTLGGNKVLLDKVKDMTPDAQISIVQDRTVSRRNRFEFSPELATVAGGDSYNITRTMGMNAHYHITPQWSLGVKYEKAFNKLTNEGQALVAQAEETGQALIPDIDYPKQSTMALINFYPIYGKMNLYDMGILHFDFYGIAGYGQISLRSGNTPTYTFGGGMGMWFSQHLTSRLEARYQNYQATRYTGKTSMDLTVLSLQIGYLL